MFSRGQNGWAVICFTFLYFYVPVSSIIHEDMWITWLSTEAGINEPFGSSKMMPRFLSLSTSSLNFALPCQGFINIAQVQG
jgi:hypothetical protein